LRSVICDLVIGVQDDDFARFKPGQDPCKAIIPFAQRDPAQGRAPVLYDIGRPVAARPEQGPDRDGGQVVFAPDRDPQGDAVPIAKTGPGCGIAGQDQDQLDALFLDSQGRDLGRGGRFDALDLGRQSRATPAFDRGHSPRCDADGVRGQKLDHDFHICRIADFKQRLARLNDLFAFHQNTQDAATGGRANLGAADARDVSVTPPQNRAGAVAFPFAHGKIGLGAGKGGFGGVQIQHGKVKIAVRNRALFAQGGCAGGIGLPEGQLRFGAGEFGFGQAQRGFGGLQRGLGHLARPLVKQGRGDGADPRDHGFTGDNPITGVQLAAQHLPGDGRGHGKDLADLRRSFLFDLDRDRLPRDGCGVDHDRTWPERPGESPEKGQNQSKDHKSSGHLIPSSSGLRSCRAG
jgi:hypothetical protein